MSGADQAFDGGGGWRVRAARRMQSLLHRVPLLLFAAAAFAGIVVDAWVGSWIKTAVGIEPFLLWLSLIPLLGLFAIVLPKRMGIAVLFLLAVPLAAARHAVSDAQYESAGILAIADALGQPVIADVMIDRPLQLRKHPLAGLPSRRDLPTLQTQLEARLLSVRIGEEYRHCSGRVLVVCDGRLQAYLPGDRLRVFGSIRSFPAPNNPGERDLRKVYRRRGLHARIDVSATNQLVLQEHGRGFPFYRAIGAIADYSREALIRHTSDANGPLALALVIGQRDLVSNQIRDSLLVTGTAHLLSVSGLHLAIIVVLAHWLGLLLGFPVTVRILWILLVCVLYTAITGGRPPVMRASILVATFMVSIWIRRQGQPMNTLSLAAILLLAINPENAFSVGVQLSFLAVATLLLCGSRPVSGTPAVEQALEREQRLEALRESALPAPIRYLRWVAGRLWQAAWFSGCVTVISIPLVWHQFHVVSLVSVLTNVVLSLLLFVGLAAGVAVVALAWLVEPAAACAGWICDVSLSCMLWVIRLAASIPMGHFWLPSPPGWWVAIFYAAIAITMMFAVKPRITSLRVSWIVIWMTSAWWMATTPATMNDCVVEATFIDVGHGTSVVLRYADDDVWLYDCGRMGNDPGTCRDIDATLWSLGVTRLKGIVLSHADADHYNAVPGVLRRFSVEQIITPPGMLAEPEADLAAVRRAIAAAGVPVTELFAGAEIPVTGTRMRVLHPPAQRLTGSDNANSLVIIAGDGVPLVLPGDLEPPGTAVLVNRPRPSPGGVLMAPHHGSLTMDASAVLQWARPRETVVSGGRRARRVAVRQMLAAYGSGVHVTAIVGAIRVRIGKDGRIQVHSWLQSPWARSL